ncbi:inner nuclear membrane protein enriched at telomere/subtelomere region [Umbelopsis nana]
MDVPPDLYYLSEDFDANHLRVAELRGILLKHDVPYSPSAKKPELLQAFQSKVAGKSKEILKLHRQLKPNGKGIIHVDKDKKSRSSTRTSSRKDVIDDEEHDDVEEGNKSIEEESSTAKARREKRAAKSANMDAEGFAIPAQPSSKPKSSALRKKAKNTWTVGSGLTSESEIESVPSSAKYASATRKKEKSKEPEEEPSTEKKHKEPVFTDTNPFQSGADSDVSGMRKGKKIALPEPSHVVESKTPHSTSQSHKVPTSKSVKPESTHQKVENAKEDITVSTRRSKRDRPSAGQYFNPQDSFASSGGEDEQTVERKPAKTALKTKSKTSTSSPKPEVTPKATTSSSSNRQEYSVIINRRSKHPLHQVVAIGLSVLIGLYCIFWCLERHRIGYCDIPHENGVNGTHVELLDLDTNATTIWEAMRPSCIPCPKHGHCTRGRLLGCDDFFVRIPSMLSFGGWIPVGEKCVPDTVKQRRAFRVENQIKNMLAVKKGQYVCGEIKAEKGQSAEEVASMKVEDVWAELLARKPDTISEQQLEEYWRLAMASLMTYSEREVTFLDRGDDKYMISRQPKLSLGCRLRLQIKDAVYRWRYELGGLSAIASIIAYANYRYLQRRKDMKLVAELAGEAFVKLQEQERNHYVDPVLFPQACCAISHLRDLILAQEPSVERRHYLWNHVRKIVESNSNVRTLSAEVRGEPHRCWEWVGYGQSSERITVGSGVEIHSGDMVNAA